MIKRDLLSVGAWVVAGTLLVHSIVLLFLEPSMGFREFSDYVNLDKVIPALNSPAWILSNAMHIALGLGLLAFSSGVRAFSAKHADFAAALGSAAAPVFVMVGMSGFVGALLIELLTDHRELDTAILGMIGLRMVLLYSAVALLGVMVLALSFRSELCPLWVRVLGVPVALAAIVFVLVPTPVPLFLFVWAAAFTITRSSDASSAAAL